jgi:hypothetical protein
VIDGSYFTITASDNVGVDRYMVTLLDVKPELSDPGWRPNNSIAINRSGRFYFWAKDKAGNISEANANAFQVIVKAAPYKALTNLVNLGLIAAQDEETGLWGYIGLSGEYLINPIYTDAGSFQENGLAVVKSGDLYMVMNTRESIVVGPSDHALVITENGLIYEEDTPNSYDSTGAWVYVLPNDIDGYSDNHWYKSNCTYYDETGQVMLEYNGNWTCHNFVNGMAFIEESGTFDESEESGLVGHYIDPTGTKVIAHFETPSLKNTLFDNISSVPVYGDGGNWESFYFAANGTAVMKGSNGLLGYVNKTGAWTISPKFVKAGSFNANGIAVVAVKNSSGELIYGLINESGKYVVSPKYELIWKFYSDLTVFRDSSGNLGYINAKGAVVIKTNATWSTASAFFGDGYARVQNDYGLYGIIDRSGKLIVDYMFGGIK